MPGEVLEDLSARSQTGVLSNRLKRQLAAQPRGAKLPDPPVALEMFSPPRMVPEAAAVGFKGLGSLDICTGWGLPCVAQQNQAWELLVHERPWSVGMSPMQDVERAAAPI